MPSKQPNVCAVESVNHVGIVARDLETAVKLYCDIFGLKPGPVKELLEHGVKAVMVDVGGVHLEFLQPTRTDSGIGRFLESHGEGLHHVALQVDDIKGKVETLKRRGIELIDQEPRQGLSGIIAFIHPKGMHGTLVELVQPQ